MVGQVGVSEAVVHVCRTRISQFIEFQDLNRLFRVALLQTVVAQHVYGRLRKEKCIRILLLRFLKQLPCGRRAARLRQHVPEFCNRRGLGHCLGAVRSGCLPQGLVEPFQNHGLKSLFHGEHVCAVARSFERHELVLRIARKGHQPAHVGQRIAVVFAGGDEERQAGGRLQKCAALFVGVAGEKHESLYFGMSPRQLNGIVHAAACPAGAEARFVHAGLVKQILEGGVDIARPLLPRSGLLLGGEGEKTLAAAFAISAIVERENVNARRRELRGEWIPRLALAVALVQQQYTRPRLPSRVVSNLKLQTVRCREVRVLLCHLRACGCDPQERSASQRDYLECLFHPLLPLTLSLSSGHGFQPPVRAPKKRLQRLGKDLENDRTTLLVIKAMNECHLSRRHSLSQSISGNSRLKVRVSAALYNAPGPDTKRFQR